MNGVWSSSTRGLRFVSCVPAPLGNRRDLTQDAQLPPSFFNALLPLCCPHVPTFLAWLWGTMDLLSPAGSSWDSVAVSVLMTCKLWRAHVLYLTPGYWKIHSIGGWKHFSSPHLTLMSHRLGLHRRRIRLALWNLTCSACPWSSCTLISLTGSS